MTVRDDLDLFSRSVRRHVRNHVMDRGEVPALCAVTSVGWNPRKLRGQMSLHLLAEAVDVKGQLEGMLREHCSRYAAVGSLVPDEGGGTLLLAVFDASRCEKWQASADLELGLSGWERSEFRFDEHWAQRLMAATVV